MSDARPRSHLDLDGTAPEEAFAILGNEIRLDIIRVLWQADATHVYDDGTEMANQISYSELRRSVEVDDNGKFNYHLSKLSPTYVRQTDDGYRLSGAGKQIARTVIAVSGSEYVDLSAELDEDCPLCGATMNATYEDQWLRIRCTRCEGLFGDEAPRGTLFLTTFPAAGLPGRSAEEVVSTGLYRCALDITYMMYGICRECAGGIAASVTVCGDHDAGDDRPCTACGTPFEAWAEMWCETCGFAKRLPVEMFVTGFVTVLGLLELGAFSDPHLSFGDTVDVLQRSVETTRSTDPFRLSVEFDVGSRPVSVTLDETMTVLDIDPDSRMDAV